MFKVPTFVPPLPAPTRHAANWMLLAAALVLSFHWQHTPLWLTFSSGCLVLWRFLVENQGWRPPSRILVLLFAIVALVAIYRQYGSFLGRDAGVGFLVLLTGLKLLELRSLRDYLIVVFLLYFLTLSAFLFSQSLLAGAYAAAVAAMTTAALIRLNQPRAMDTRSTLRLMWGLAVRAVPVMLVFYLLFPRIHGSLWGMPQEALGRTGLADRLEPGQIQRLLNDDSVALRAEFDDKPPAFRDLYWRSFVLSEFDGRAWTRASDIRSIFNAAAFNPVGPPLHYTVTIQPHQQLWLVSLGLPEAAPDGTRLRRDHVLEATHRVTQPVRYTLDSYLSYNTGEISAFDWQRQLQLPFVDPRIEAMTREWQRLGDAKQIVRTALQYFHDQGFRYTLSPPALGSDPVADFLFRTRAGYCEHFATSFVTLMRAAGVPARVVIGYQGGEWNSNGDYMIVRQSDAHAWAEVYLPGDGWTRVDPTSAVAPERIELGLAALRRLVAQGTPVGSIPQDELRRLARPGWLQQQWLAWRLRWDSLNTVWNRWVMAYGPDAQTALLSWLGIDAPGWAKLVLTAVVAVIFLLLLTATLLFYPRAQGDPVVRCYRTFCARLARLGIERAAHEGPVAYARRVTVTRPDLREPVAQITEMYVRLRYGQSTATGIAAYKHRVAAFRPRARPLSA